MVSKKKPPPKKAQPNKRKPPPAAPAKPPKRTPPKTVKPDGADWEAIERDFRAGILSYAEMGLLHGISKGRISQVATEKGWTRDLQAKIRAQAESKVNAATVNAELNETRAVSEALTVEIGATVIARVKMAQRGQIQRGIDQAMRLLEELELDTVNLDNLKELGELLRSEDEKGRDHLNDLYHKAISLSGRSTVMKQIAETLKIMLGMQSTAFGITGGEEDPGKPKLPPAGTKDPADVYRWMASQRAGTIAQ